MRPVNLMPADDRRRRSAASGGATSFLIVGFLLAILAGVTALVLTGNQIDERKAEVAQLEQDRAAAQVRVAGLQAFADFRSMQQARTATVSSLAQSRFDWERVIRELTYVLPSDVWLVELEGTVSPDVQLENAAGISARDAVAGPALELIGCTVSQDAVGRFASALGDIDGVTRVSVLKSERPELSESLDAGGDSGGEDECRTRDSVTRFEIIAAFDAVPVAASAPAAPAPTSPPATEEAPDESTTPPDTTDEGAQGSQDVANPAPGS